LAWFISSMLYSQPPNAYVDNQPFIHKTNNYTTPIETDTFISFNELTIESRLTELNFQTPIHLEFNNDVKKYIEYFLTKRSDVITRSLAMSSYYFPIFETCLDKYQLPMELKYLAVVESGLNPFARSKSGAVGLWQFLLPTAQLLNLKVTSLIDERRDPIKSTEAACQYLEYLFNMYNDWQLAIAAYNGGPSVIKNAIIRSGGKSTFWEIKPYLPIETQNYVPAFIAAVYLMNFSKDYFQLTSEENTIYFHQADTVLINQPLYFNDISSILNIPLETLRFLNPAYKQDYIPKQNSSVPLILPSDKIADFIKQSKSILKHELPNQQLLTSQNNKRAITYTVKKGDYLTKLAIAFRCSPDDIKKWNNLPSNEIVTGSHLLIWCPEDNLFTIVE